MSRSSWVGQQIDGRLPLLEWLGTIESADVFRTRLPDGIQAAILVAAGDDENAAERLRMGEIAMELSHPHLQRVFECGNAQLDGLEIVYLVAEMPEEALGQVLPERALTPEEVHGMLPPALDALDYLHGLGLVHGGVEPAKILVVDDKLKLSADSLQPAGSFRVFEEAPRIYDAPEIEAAPLTPAADIWALGVTIIAALTQKTPAFVRSSGRAPLVPVTVPQPFAEIARRCLRVDAAERCTVPEIRALLAGTALPAPPPSVADDAVSLGAAVQTELFPPSSEVQAGADAQHFRMSIRSIDEEEPTPRQFPIALTLGAALVLLMLIVGMVTYAHRSRSTADASANPAAHDSSREPKAIKPLPQPSGPTVKGEVAQRVVPEIPARQSRGIRGTVAVKIKVVVDHSGGVMNAAIESAAGSRYFANQALEAARKWHFRPAKIHGQPASSVWQLRFTFTKTGTQVTPVEVTP